MNRRQLLQFTAVAAAAPLPQIEGQATGTPDGIRTAAWKPRVFDAHQNETVVALTELIIPATDSPGAKAALVNRYMDLLLADGPDEQRNRFLEGLSWLDGYALRKHSQPFVRCTEQQQIAILTELDAGKAEELAPGTRFFRYAKMLTARIYYATEIGFKELNKGGRVPPTYACRNA
jgi:hypothetical protein